MYFFEVFFNDFIQYTRNGGGGLKPVYVDIRELHAVISLTTENDGNLFFKQQNVWHSCTSIVLREIRNIGKRRGNETDSCNVLLHFTFFEHSTQTFHISWNSLRITGKRFSFLHLLSKKKKTSRIAASTKEVTFKNVVGLVVAAIVGFFLLLIVDLVFLLVLSVPQKIMKTPGRSIPFLQTRLRISQANAHRMTFVYSAKLLSYNECHNFSVVLTISKLVVSSFMKIPVENIG